DYYCQVWDNSSDHWEF
nr:immunoglobulin light chain junction region [Macaca mulatta]